MTTRPSSNLNQLQRIARPAEVAMLPGELGTARQTRHSFARALVRNAVANNWGVSRRHWEMDGKGQGVAIYRIDASDKVVELVIFSKVISEDQRTDRVIAEDWDVTAALVDGQVTDTQLQELKNHVTLQEDGRANDISLIWARANRSARYFDYVVEQLASGQQPDPANMSDAAYIMRSTAFYGNGKWGLRDFDGIRPDHPLSLPYRAQMLAAWLLREFSADLADHCARASSDDAVPLSREWRRFLGLGNATGLGMVPYVIRHPQVLDAWVALRELPLTHALTQKWSGTGLEWIRVCALVARAQEYFAEKQSFSTDPYPSGPELSRELDAVATWCKEFAERGTIDSQPCSFPAKRLHELSGEKSVELRQIVDSILVEVSHDLDIEIESLLMCVDRTYLEPQMTIEDLKKATDQAYSWVLESDFSDANETARFWFYSANNQEPRRGMRDRDPGLINEHPVGVAHDVSALTQSLNGVSNETTVAEFLAQHPQHWGIIERIQSVSDLPYAEARINPLSEEFLPLDLQRFQLAVYGMENFNPQSTDWLRVTLYGGAPSVQDVVEGGSVDDWLFSPRPKQAV